MRLKVNAFERWCYRMILGISWRDKLDNRDKRDKLDNRDKRDKLDKG